MSSSAPISSIYPMPRLEIPPPICSNIPGTWAYDTMSRRINEEILQRTAEDCADDFNTLAFEKIQKSFIELRNELKNASNTKLQHLDKPYDYDTNLNRRKEWDEWYALLKPYIDNNETWLSAPWMVTEFYVYRRLMQAIGYWTPNSAGYKYDPFSKPKRAGLLSSVGSADAMLQKIPLLGSDSVGLGIASSIALWGNKMDLSLWPANAANADVDIFSEILSKSNENLLHDDSDKLWNHCKNLKAKGGGMIDIIVDNAGFELVTDLALAQYLIESGIAKIVTFQLKSHPTFVSDALEKDLLETVDYYALLDETKYPHIVHAGITWKRMLSARKWMCNEDNFWVQPYAMWDMTEPLRSDLVNRCDLVFVKGDANYRRLLGDRVWDYSNASFDDVVGAYFPCPVCALRTLKAEVGCGMDKNAIQEASKVDKNWMTSGRFGVIQFGDSASKQKQDPTAK